MMKCIGSKHFWVDKDSSLENNNNVGQIVRNDRNVYTNWKGIFE